MKKSRKYLLVLMVFMLVSSFDKVQAAECLYVDTTQQIYSYDSMVEDIALLSVGHEDIMQYESIATTSQGRNVWLIKFGNLQAENKVLITGSIHAREYMSSQLVMKMLEEYVMNFDTVRPDGLSYRNYFDTVCFYILPMVNPDGVSISQFGVNGATQELTKNWLSLYNARQLTQIKANANGVDLNRNFPVGFGCGRKVSPIPYLYYYSGTTPLSEAETAAVAVLLDQNNFISCINYHSMGNVNYYGSAANTPENAIQCKNLANLVHSVNGYRMEYCGAANGSFADYFGVVENAPSVTIEIGTANPVPIHQFNNIYNRNVALWAILANIF